MPRCCDASRSDIIPVIAPTGLGPTAIPSNINPNGAARWRLALGATRFLLLTDVAGSRPATSS